MLNIAIQALEDALASARAAEAIPAGHSDAEQRDLLSDAKTKTGLAYGYLGAAVLSAS